MGCCTSKSPASSTPQPIPQISVEAEYEKYAHGRDSLSDSEGGNIADFFAALDCPLDKAEGFAAFYVLKLGDFSLMKRTELMQFCRE